MVIKPKAKTVEKAEFMPVNESLILNFGETILTPYQQAQ
jgi:hypothetical protein